MSHGQDDMRVKRTHMLLRQALVELIAEKGFDAVTVGDIAERAMVNRATFYRHYPDKYALVTSIFEAAVDRAVEEIGPPVEPLESLAHDWLDQDPNAFTNPSSGQAMPQALAAFTAFFEHFARHAKLYQTMLGKQGSSWFAQEMRSYMAQVLHQRLLQSQLLGVRDQDDPRAMPEPVATQCLANWLIGMLTWWLESGMDISAQQIATWCLRFIVHGYYL